MKVNIKDSLKLPVAQIFEAIVDHKKMSCYFISSADGPMMEGKRIIWEWSDQNAREEINVTKVEKNRLVRFEWNAKGKITTAQIMLEESNDKTLIHITEEEWVNDENGGIKAMQQTQGWTNFIDCLKAYLLYNINLRAGTLL